MFLIIAIILLLLWAVGYFMVPTVGALIHILLVLAIISVAWHFITGRGDRA